MIKYFEKLLQIGTLLYPQQRNYWSTLANELREQFQQPPPQTLTIKNVGRKWELVSAYQKTVRRGDAVLATRLISAMASLHGERQYMWRRICTVAAEDIGAGNPDLMAFVLAASSVFTPSTLDTNQTRALWTVLTRLMCMSTKSRLYCQFSLLQELHSESGASTPVFLSTEIGRQVGKIVSTNLRIIELPPAERWLVTANWRAAGMSVGPIWHEMLRATDHSAATLSAVQWTPPPPTMLKGLPSYAYDMHTQVGKAALTRANALPEIRKLFAENPCTDKREALGWALFYAEGGKIDRLMHSGSISNLEQSLAANRFGMPMASWLAVRGVASELVASGLMDTLRAQVLEKRAYCDNCIQLSTASKLTDADLFWQPTQQTLVESAANHE